MPSTPRASAAAPDLPDRPSLDEDARALPEAHGGHWGSHPDHPVADWMHEVAAGDTRQGYWRWVALRLRLDALDRLRGGATPDAAE